MVRLAVCPRGETETKRHLAGDKYAGSPITFFFAFIAVLALIGVAAWLVRRFANNRLGANTNRGRMPRLAVIDAAAVDGRRRLVLVRRDNIEHLLMIGGPTDIVVEPNIVRATPARDQIPQRPRSPPSRRRALRRCRIPRWGDEARGPSCSIIPSRKCPSRRRGPRAPPLPTKCAARAPPPLAERRNDPPLAGFAPEPMGGRARTRRAASRPDSAARCRATNRR